nr:hypothetical protein [Tanacetum cinerariifolium]
MYLSFHHVFILMIEHEVLEFRLRWNEVVTPSSDPEIEQFAIKMNLGFPAQSIRSSNAIALDSPYLLVLNTEASQSKQHESRKSPTAELFDVDSGRISFVTVNTKEYHSECSGNYHEDNA